MTAPAAVEAWAIKAPDGSIVYAKSNCTRDDCIDSYCGDFFWQSKEEEGYRCVRVQIIEVQE